MLSLCAGCGCLLLGELTGQRDGRAADGADGGGAGAGGKDIPERSAMGHVLGFTAGLDITVRSAADRSRRKSYDSFSPLGRRAVHRRAPGVGPISTGETLEMSISRIGTMSVSVI